MDVTLYRASVQRDFEDLALFEDLFTAPAYVGSTRDEAGWVLHFDGDLTPEQIEQVRIRSYSTPETEALFRSARAVVAANNSWRANIATQIEAEVKPIVEDADITSGDVPGYVRTLARAVRQLNIQQAETTKQVNALIQMMVREQLDI